jgi:hypothetical protein
MPSFLFVTALGEGGNAAVTSRAGCGDEEVIAAANEHGLAMVFTASPFRPERKCVIRAARLPPRRTATARGVSRAPV